MVNLEQLRLIRELREQGIEWDTIHDTVGSTDNDRKLFRGYMLGLEEESEDNIIKHAKTLQTIRTARKELGIERSINNEQIRDITLHKTFTKQVIEALKNKYVDFKVNNAQFNLPQEQAHIFTLADFHYDGDELLLDTLKRATEQIIGLVKINNLEHIYLVELGDTIEGASLRTSQLMGIKKGMVEQVVLVADAYIKMLKEIDSYVDVTFISVDSSNHTQLRNLGTKQNQLIEEDLMVVFNSLIEKALPNLDFKHDKELFVNIVGYDCFFAHGHEAKGSGVSYVKDVAYHRNLNIDFTFFAHRHHCETVDINSTTSFDKRLFFVPSLSTKLSQFEKQHNLSSKAGVGYYVLEWGLGNTQTRKLLV
jgi:hypothetical protein